MKTMLLSSLVVLLVGCSTTKLQDHWQDDSFSRNDLNNILIVGVTDNYTHRFIFESEFERAMSNIGVSGITSLDALGREFPTREGVEAYIKKHDIDYVLATRVEAVNVENDYVPPSIRTYYTGPYYSSFGAYYDGYGGNTVTLTRDAYVDTRTITILVTTIFDSKTSNPVWIGRSETFDPGSISYLATDIARATWRNISR